MKKLTFAGFNRGLLLEKMAEETYDVLVIGGGITGSGIALDAATRGMKAAVVEMQDFAGGTSSRSTKLVHGGLRYLKQLEVKMVAEVGKTHDVEVLAHRVLDPRLVGTLRLQAPGHVAGDGLPGEKRELLEHHAAIGAGTVDARALHADLARVGGDEAAHDVEQRALAAAARADDGDKLALAHGEALDVEHSQAAPVLAVGLADAGCF
jgi:glycine/D-amino acid oxidase-like deaminating enzyme